MMHNIDKIMPENPLQKADNWDDYVQKMDVENRQAFQIAREVMKRSVLIQKKYYDRKTHLIKHKVGDAVMVRNMPRPEAGTAKFHDKYIGPYYIVDVLSDVNFRICDKPDGKTKVIHHDRLKPIEQREKPDLTWVYEQSRTLQRRRAAEKSKNDNIDLTEVFDRLKQLENNLNKEVRKKKKRQVRQNPNPEVGAAVIQDGGARQEEPEVKRKRGRPRKNPAPEPKQPMDDRATRKSERLQQKKVRGC